MLTVAYVLITVIVALTIPLAVNLRARAQAELETQALVNVQTIAAGIGNEGLKDPARLKADVLRYAAQLGLGTRVIVTDAAGVVIADSQVPSDVGTNYNTPLRPEIQAALSPADPRASSIRRHSVSLHSDIMAAAAPILDEGLQGSVRVTTSVEDVSDNVRRITIALLVVGLTGLLAGMIIAYALASSLARPLTRLAETARKLGRGDLSARATDVEGASEIEALGHSFNDMASRLQRTVEAQGEFVANASHQLRTPLTGMKLRLESALADASSDDMRSQLTAADGEVDRLAETVTRLLTVARQVEEGGPTAIDLGPAAARAAERWRERAEALGASLEASGPGGRGLANPHDLDQALDNLLDNAIAYAPGPITLEVGGDGNRVFIAVGDQGPGIRPDERDRVTERFFRGKGAPPGGTGLGLTIARELTERWGGTLTVSEQTRGTRVMISLRRAES
jgi:signal transduction histidine kinase